MHKKELLSWLRVFCLCLLLTIGCSQVPQSSNSSVSSLPEFPAAEPIVIGYSNWAGWWPWAIAEQKGLFAKNNINVKMKWFDGYLDSMEAFAAGQLDGNCQTLNDTISFAAKAVNREVAVLVNDNSAGNDKIIVAEGIDTIEELKGKKVTLEEGVVNDFMLTLALQSKGMKREDVKIISLETSGAVAFFVSGQADAVGAFPPFWLTAFKREGSKELISSAEFPGSIPDLLVVSQKLIDEQPNAVQGLVNTWFDVMDFVKQNPVQADKIMAARANVTVKELQLFKEGTRMFSIEDNLEAFDSGDGMEYMPYAAKNMAEFMVEVGFIPQVLDLTTILDDRFVRVYAASVR